MVSSRATPGLNRKRQIVGLDLTRAAAALFVVLFHLGIWAWVEPGLRHAPVVAGRWSTPLLSAGWVGVEIFFVLSGFVIAYSTEGATPVRFLRHRFRRLFPTALICATITGVFRMVVAYTWRETSVEWLRSIIFFPVGPWVDGTYWTLPVEVSFYLLFLLMLFWSRARHLPAVMAGVALISTGVCLLLLYAPSWAPLPVLAFLASCWFRPHACKLLMYVSFFALGVFLYLGLLRGFTIFRGLIILLSFTGCVVEILWREQGLIVPSQRHGYSLYPLALWGVAVLLMIASVHWNAAVQDYVGQASCSMARKIGLTTYPLYLLHANMGEWLMHGLSYRIGYGLSICLVTCSMAFLAAFVALAMEPWLQQRLPL